MYPSSIASYSYSALSQSDELDKILDLDSKEPAYHDTSDEVSQPQTLQHNHKE